MREYTATPSTVSSLMSCERTVCRVFFVVVDDGDDDEKTDGGKSCFSGWNGEAGTGPVTLHCKNKVWHAIMICNSWLLTTFNDDDDDDDVDELDSIDAVLRVIDAMYPSSPSPSVLDSSDRNSCLARSMPRTARASASVRCRAS